MARKWANQYQQEVMQSKPTLSIGGCSAWLYKGRDFQNARGATVKGTEMLLIEMNDGQGGKLYEERSLNNWQGVQRNFSEIAQILNGIKGKAAEIKAQQQEPAVTFIRNLKGAGAAMPAIKAAVLAQYGHVVTAEEFDRVAAKADEVTAT